MRAIWATYADALQEAGGRKVVLILTIMAVVVGLLFNRSVSFGEINGVAVVYQGPLSMGPAPFAVPVILGQQVSLTGTIWIMIMIFTGGPQFVAMFERGWRELTFSKGTARWQILFARYFSTISLFFILTLTSNLPLTLRFWWHTGILTWQVAIGVLIVTVGFAALLAAGVMASMAGENVSIPIMAPIATMILSMFLQAREGLYHDYITSWLGRRAMDWAYYIVPKINELSAAASTFIQSSTISTSWPLWTTALFALGTLALAMWLLERRSF